IHITEGLVKRCKNDSELAALLCLELAKMVSERESLSAARRRDAEARPPIEVPVGGAGQPGGTDPVAPAGLGKYENDRKQAARRHLPPDPYALAAEYLEKAGYAKGGLEAVAPLLEAADRNYLIEKQFKGSPGNAPQWSPVAAP